MTQSLGLFALGLVCDLAKAVQQTVTELVISLLEALLVGALSLK